ncbi:MAG: hypothetical protein IKX14_03015 [Neisseriaceae bacterium]|nr:hypothetical protein [Neisseriaceae bacterium]
MGNLLPTRLIYIFRQPESTSRAGKSSLRDFSIGKNLVMTRFYFWAT